MSAAGALSTALAVAGLFSIPRSKAIEVAHLAELFGGGGLGGVAAILGGGLEVRTRPGIPPLGRVIHQPFRRRVIVGVVGEPLPSPKILADPKRLTRIENAWEGSAPIGPTMGLSEFLEASERFTDQVRLAPRRLVRTLGALREEGVWAAQAMFGSSFFALPRSPSARRAALRTLERSGIRAVELYIGERGACRLPVASRPSDE
jgi:pantoate kinase